MATNNTNSSNIFELLGQQPQQQQRPQFPQLGGQQQQVFITAAQPQLIAQPPSSQQATQQPEQPQPPTGATMLLETTASQHQQQLQQQQLQPPVTYIMAPAPGFTPHQQQEMQVVGAPVAADIGDDLTAPGLAAPQQLQQQQLQPPVTYIMAPAPALAPYQQQQTQHGEAPTAADIRGDISAPGLTSHQQEEMQLVGAPVAADIGDDLTSPGLAAPQQLQQQQLQPPVTYIMGPAPALAPQQQQQTQHGEAPTAKAVDASALAGLPPEVQLALLRMMQQQGQQQQQPLPLSHPSVVQIHPGQTPGPTPAPNAMLQHADAHVNPNAIPQHHDQQQAQQHHQQILESGADDTSTTILSQALPLPPQQRSAPPTHADAQQQLQLQQHGRSAPPTSSAIAPPAEQMAAAHPPNSSLPPAPNWRGSPANRGAFALEFHQRLSSGRAGGRAGGRGGNTHNLATATSSLIPYPQPHQQHQDSKLAPSADEAQDSLSPHMEKLLGEKDLECATLRAELATLQRELTAKTKQISTLQQSVKNMQEKYNKLWFAQNVSTVKSAAAAAAGGGAAEVPVDGTATAPPQVSSTGVIEGQQPKQRDRGGSAGEQPSLGLAVEGRLPSTATTTPAPTTIDGPTGVRNSPSNHPPRPRSYIPPVDDPEFGPYITRRLQEKKGYLAAHAMDRAGSAMIAVAVSLKDTNLQQKNAEMIWDEIAPKNYQYGEKKKTPLNKILASPADYGSKSVLAVLNSRPDLHSKSQSVKRIFESCTPDVILSLVLHEATSVSFGAMFLCPELNELHYLDVYRILTQNIALVASSVQGQNILYAAVTGACGVKVQTLMTKWLMDLHLYPLITERHQGEMMNLAKWNTFSPPNAAAIAALSQQQEQQSSDSPTIVHDNASSSQLPPQLPSALSCETATSLVSPTSSQNRENNNNSNENQLTTPISSHISDDAPVFILSPSGGVIPLQVPVGSVLGNRAAKYLISQVLSKKARIENMRAIVTSFNKAQQVRLAEHLNEERDGEQEREEQQRQQLQNEQVHQANQPSLASASLDTKPRNLAESTMEAATKSFAFELAEFLRHFPKGNWAEVAYTEFVAVQFSNFTVLQQLCVHCPETAEFVKTCFIEPLVQYITGVSPRPQTSNPRLNAHRTDAEPHNPPPPSPFQNRQHQDPLLETAGEGSGVGLTTPTGYRNLYIKNLVKETTEEQFRAIFAPYGEITSLGIRWDSQRGFEGFVDFKEPEDAAKAVAALNDKPHEMAVENELVHVRRFPSKQERLRKQEEAQLREETHLREASGETSSFGTNSSSDNSEPQAQGAENLAGAAAAASPSSSESGDTNSQPQSTQVSAKEIAAEDFWLAKRSGTDYLNYCQMFIETVLVGQCAVIGSSSMAGASILQETVNSLPKRSAEELADLEFVAEVADDNSNAKVDDAEEGSQPPRANDVVLLGCQLRSDLVEAIMQQENSLSKTRCGSLLLTIVSRESSGRTRSGGLVSTGPPARSEALTHQTDGSSNPPADAVPPPALAPPSTKPISNLVWVTSSSSDDDADDARMGSACHAYAQRDMPDADGKTGTSGTSLSTSDDVLVQGQATGLSGGANSNRNKVEVPAPSYVKGAGGRPGGVQQIQVQHQFPPPLAHLAGSSSPTASGNNGGGNNSGGNNNHGSVTLAEGPKIPLSLRPVAGREVGGGASYPAGRGGSLPSRPGLSYFNTQTQKRTTAPPKPGTTLANQQPDAGQLVHSNIPEPLPEPPLRGAPTTHNGTASIVSDESDLKPVDRSGENLPPAASRGRSTFFTGKLGAKPFYPSSLQEGGVPAPASDQPPQQQPQLNEGVTTTTAPLQPPQ